MSRLFVLAGPSGVGKGTIVKELLSRYPQLHLSISATTRDPRPGEVDGRDYYFLNRETFEKQINTNSFIEWAQVHGKHLYGTPKAPVQKALQSGKTVLVEIDLEGSRKIRACGIDASYIFIAPPSMQILEERLTGRATESREQIERRLLTAQAEMAAQSEFDHIVVNHTVTQAANDIASLLGLD